MRGVRGDEGVLVVDGELLNEVCVFVCVWGGGGERGEYRVGRDFVRFTPGATRCL